MGDMRIVVLGKTGAGKSSLCNTIFGEDVFEIRHTAKSQTNKCQKETKPVGRRSITLIDTPGFFNTDEPEETLRSEIVKCIIECTPGPHAFLIVLKVEKCTEHENQVISKIQEYFSEEALKYAVVVLTHGDQLQQKMKIEEFVQQNKNLSDLVSKCGGRCHILDNKYWNNQQDEYRNNKYQVEKLLTTIEAMVDKGDYYTNEMLQEVERNIQEEKKRIRESSENMSEEEIGKKAKSNVSSNLLKKIAGVTTGALLGALLGVPVFVVTVATYLLAARAAPLLVSAVPAAAAAGGGAAAAAGGGAAAAAGGGAAAAAGGGAAATPVGLVVAGVCAGIAATGGAVVGGLIGYDEADRADTVKEAVENTAKAVCNTAVEIMKPFKCINQQQDK